MKQKEDDLKMFQKNQKSIFCIIRSPAIDESATIIAVNIHSEVLFFNNFDDNLLKILMLHQFWATVKAASAVIMRNKTAKIFFPVS